MYDLPPSIETDPQWRSQAERQHDWGADAANRVRRFGFTRRVATVESRNVCRTHRTLLHCCLCSVPERHSMWTF